MKTPENWTQILSKVLDVAEKVSPLLAGTPVGAVVAVGQSVLNLIDEVREVATEDQAEALRARRAELEPLVMAHLDRTIDRLG